MDYENRSGRYRIRLKLGEVKKHRGILTEVVKEAFDASR